jgi:DNA-binding NarL/FixJ family response regulator
MSQSIVALRDERRATMRVMPLRVVIADDHGIVRDGVRLALDAMGDECCVVGEVSDGASVVRICRELSPDVVVLDIKMPQGDGVSVARQLGALDKPPRVIALSGHADAETVRDMLAAGAVGYVLKTEVGREIVHAIRAIAKHECYLSPRIAGCVVGLVTGTQPSVSSLRRLSAREREVLLLVADGLSTKEIADRLAVSVKTVETQRKSVMEKLGIFSIAGLTKYAIREGLVEL